MSNMASIAYYLVFSGFIFAAAHSFSSENLKEWDVERSSVNPLSYTDEDHYFSDVTTENPLLRSLRRRLNCPANEHYTRCDANCEKTCDNYKKPIPCPRLCIWGCVCNLGLVRGPDKRCIKPTECSTKSQAEAQQNFLTDITHSDTQSEETGNSLNSMKGNPPASKSKLWPIPIPLICGKDELLDPCPSSCPDDCNNFRHKHRNCMRICIPSCVCKSGLVRSHDGKCIEPHECPQEKNFCPRGEEYSPCHSQCEGNCATGEKNKNNCQRDGMLCVSGCTCKAGLVRGPDGNCIYDTECPTTPPTEPPTKVCPENERFEECKAACQRNCSNVHSAIPCPRICQPGCVCKESLVRGKYGKCIEKDECSTDGSSPDSYVTLNPPPYTDDDYHIPESVTKILPISEMEDSQFEEIPPMSHSKPSHECPPRHRWVVCGGHCQRNCSNKDEKDFGCRPVCIPGCICEEGLVVGPDGDCIEKEKCPSESDSEGDQFPFPIPIICGKNEYRELCPSTCPDDCNNYQDKNRKCGKICIPACICAKGFVRGPNGKCIRPNECPNDKKDDCKKDEMYSQCHGNCEKNCSNWAFDLVCPERCVSGCVCRSGRIRGPDGNCILWSKCPKRPSSYPGIESSESPLPIKPAVSENNRLNASNNAGCPDDNECTISCRHYGHRYGHCTGRNSLVCSCYIENDENDEQNMCHIVDHICPDDKLCDCACRTYLAASRGQCARTGNTKCICYKNGREFEYL